MIHCHSGDCRIMNNRRQVWKSSFQAFQTRVKLWYPTLTRRTEPILQYLLPKLLADIGETLQRATEVLKNSQAQVENSSWFQVTVYIITGCVGGHLAMSPMCGGLRYHLLLWPLNVTSKFKVSFRRLNIGNITSRSFQKRRPVLCSCF